MASNKQLTALGLLHRPSQRQRMKKHCEMFFPRMSPIEKIYMGRFLYYLLFCKASPPSHRVLFLFFFETLLGVWFFRLSVECRLPAVSPLIIASNPTVILYMLPFSMSMAAKSQVRVFFFQAEDGIRDCLLSRGLGDVYKRQIWKLELLSFQIHQICLETSHVLPPHKVIFFSFSNSSYSF